MCAHFKTQQVLHSLDRQSGLSLWRRSVALSIVVVIIIIFILYLGSIDPDN